MEDGIVIEFPHNKSGMCNGLVLYDYEVDARWRSLAGFSFAHTGFVWSQWRIECSVFFLSREHRHYS